MLDRVRSDTVKINHLALRAIRERSGISQTAAAEAADVDRPNYAHIEAGRRPGTPEQISRIASALRVPVGAIALMDGESPVEAVA